LGENGHVRLAAWRETGALLGVCAAAAAPTLFATVTTAPFTGFALAFALLALLALYTMRNAWDVKPDAAAKTDDVSFKQLLKDSVAKKLLIVALLNAAPVAVSSTVFLFYVESRLGLVGWEGGLLILFFLAAAAAAPIWARFAARFGAKPVLLCAMALAVAVFSLTLTLQEGDLFLFALICFASGATLGADMTLLPAIFSARLETIAPGSARAFGLWSFASKFALALAAVLVLPTLEFSGFQAGASNDATALATLTALYALLPCILKCLAIIVLIVTPIKET